MSSKYIYVVLNCVYGLVWMSVDSEVPLAEPNVCLG